MVGTLQIMKSKLTITIEKTVLEKAKSYALERDISLDQLIETFLIGTLDPQAEKNIPISSFVKSRTSGITIPSDYDYKKRLSGLFGEEISMKRIFLDKIVIKDFLCERRS